MTTSMLKAKKHTISCHFCGVSGDWYRIQLGAGLIQSPNTEPNLASFAGIRCTDRLECLGFHYVAGMRFSLAT